MTIKDDHEHFKRRLHWQQGRVRSPTAQARECGDGRDRSSEMRSNVNEARVFWPHLRELREELQAKDLLLLCRASQIVEAAEIIADLKKQNRMLERRLEEKTEEAEALNRDTSDAKAVIEDLKEEVQALGDSRAKTEAEQLEVMDELQKVKPHLAWITLRNLVDKVQAKLAMTAGLVDGDPSYNHSVHQRSLIWRKKLGGVNHRDDKERMRIAQSLFSGPKTNGSSASTAALCFLHSSGGHLVTDIVSEMRQRGDEIAHSRLTLRDVTQAIDCIEMTAEREEGIKALANFLNLY